MSTSGDRWQWAALAGLGLVFVAGLGLVFVAVDDEAPSSPSSPAAVVWPLPEWPPSTVQRWTSGARSFGAHRDATENTNAHQHAGVDLGPPKQKGNPSRAYGARVLAPVAGVVDLVGGGWSGGETARVELVTDVGRIVLGAVKPVAPVVKGQHVEAGELVAWVGKYPGGSTMLHLEQHKDKRVKWPENAPQPAGLIDPRLGVLRAWV